VNPTQSAQTYDLFIFDFDGTLADSRLNITSSMNAAFTHFGYTVVDPNDIHPLIGKLSFEQTFRKFQPQLDTDQVGALMSHARGYQREHLQNEMMVFPDTVATLQTLKDQGKALAVLTTKYVEQMEYILQAMGLRPFFDVVYGDGLIAAKKPDRACVEYIWNNLSAPILPERSVMIGDSEVDVLCAQNAGIDAIGVGRGVDSLDYLREKGAIYTLDTLAELMQFI
jgi:HAD superfamily hydrolase (TIGR01549 family)